MAASARNAAPAGEGARASPSGREWVVLALLVAAVYGASQWWQGHADERAADRVAALARPGDIVMLSSTTCVYCQRARQWFAEHRVPVRECFIETDPACAARYQATGAAGTPTLLVRGARQLGFSAAQVADALAAAPAAP